MLTRENMEAKSAKNKLATIEKVDCEKKIHKIEYKTRELVNYWIGDEVHLLKNRKIIIESYFGLRLFAH